MPDMKVLLLVLVVVHTARCLASPATPLTAVQCESLLNSSSLLYDAQKQGAACIDQDHHCWNGTCKAYEYGSVRVRIGRAVITGADAMGTVSDPFLRIFWPGGRYETAFHKDTYAPDFNEEFEVQRLHQSDHLTIEAMDKDVRIDDLVGKIELRPHQVYSSGSNGQDVRYHMQNGDYIMIRSTWQNVL